MTFPFTALSAAARQEGLIVAVLICTAFGFAAGAFRIPARDAVLGYLKAYHPDAVLDFMCMGPEEARARYGLDAIPLLWCANHMALIAPSARSAFTIASRTAFFVTKCRPSICETT